jgi:SAM-dependent methyltransferase
MPVYDKPRYYEIAFSFVDIESQVDLFHAFIEEHSKRAVRRVLDIGCGPAQQLREMVKRGYEGVGLDRSPEMLGYLTERAEEEGVTIETVQADMTDFRLDEKVDFAFILMDTIGLIGGLDKFLSHIDSVADSMNSGGLYLIENMKLNWASDEFFGSQSWTMEEDGVRVETTYSVELVDALAQMLRETMTMEVDDHGEHTVLQETLETRMIFPQEFITLVELKGEFEFLGWFERNTTRRLAEASQDNIALLRRR